MCGRKRGLEIRATGWQTLFDGDDERKFGIYAIQVDPNYQNQGIGTNTIRRTLMIPAEHGIPELHLWRKDDPCAQSLYEPLDSNQPRQYNIEEAKQ